MKLIEFHGSQFTKRETYAETPTGILLTLPAAWFREFEDGEQAFWDSMRHIKEEETLWYHTISSVPKQEVLYAYIVFGGKVQARLTVVDFLKNHTMSFQRNGGIAHFPDKNWALLTDPVKAPSDFFMRGFQGFRYSALIF